MKTLSMLCLLLAAALLAAGAAGAGGVLNFRSELEAESSVVTLLDLVSSPGALDQVSRRRLAAVKVAIAPHRYGVRWLDGRRVRQALKRAALPKGLSVLIPPRIKLRRATRRLPADRLAAAYRSALIARLGPQGAEADIHSVRVYGNPVIPAGKTSLSVRFGSRRLLGRVPATVEASVEGRRAAAVQVVGRVERYGHVVVAVRTLMPRHVIERADLRLARMDLSSAGPGAVSDPAEVVGLATRSLVTAGKAIDRRRLMRIALIKRGAIVTMVAQAPGLKVTARGKAMQTGYRGGRIRLINLVSKREVFGKVIDSGTVLVHF